MRVRISLDTDIIEKIKELSHREKENGQVEKNDETVSQYIAKILQEHILATSCRNVPNDKP